jgi:hypothetical protein
VYWWACGAKCPDGPYVTKDCKCACECLIGGNCRSWSEATPAPTSATPPPTSYQPKDDHTAKKETESEPVPPAADSEQRGLVIREVEVVLIVLGFLLILIPLLCYGCFVFCRSRKLARVFPWDDDEVEPPRIVLRSPETSRQKADVPQILKLGEMSSRRSAAEEFEDASTATQSRNSTPRDGRSLHLPGPSSEHMNVSPRSNESRRSSVRSNGSRRASVTSIRSRSSEPRSSSAQPMNEPRRLSVSSVRSRSCEPRSSVSPPNVSPRSSASEGSQKYYPGWDLRVNRNQSLPPAVERRSVNRDRSLPPLRVSQSRSPR